MDRILNENRDSHQQYVNDANNAYQRAEEGEEMSISNSSHPFACIFTFAFKVAAFAMYFYRKTVTSFLGCSSVTSIPLFW